jgi:aromatic-L-amino-acid/L-tryptophan decarboxylase
MTGMDSHPAFAWSSDEVRRVGHRVADLIADYLEQLPGRAVFQPVPTASAEAMIAATIPVRGRTVDGILDDFSAAIAAYPFGNGHPRFYGWVNSPPAPIGVLTEALAAAMNPSVAGGNHAAVWIERQVGEWVKSLLGYPSGAMAMLVSGGSIAALTALAVARHRACSRIGWDVRAGGVPARPPASHGRLVAYKGGEGHGCNQKAIELLGIGADQLRAIPHDRDLRIQPDALDRMLGEDVAAGHVPVAVIASAGTVNTGAIDPLDAIATVCERHGVWLHVDAAYGGPAILTRSYRDALAPLARADSVALDPHKWMYVPVDAGMVLVRDGSLMREAFSLVPPYLRTDGNLKGVQGPTWFSEYGPEQTRPFRALKVWAALQYFGVDGYRSLLEHDLQLARHLADRVRAAKEFLLWEPTGLSIVCFRALPEGVRGNPEAADALNRRLLETLQLSGAGFLSGTVVDGRFWLRACIVNPLATQLDIDAVFDALVDHLGQIITADTLT